MIKVGTVALHPLMNQLVSFHVELRHLLILEEIKLEKDSEKTDEEDMRLKVYTTECANGTVRTLVDRLESKFNGSFLIFNNFYVAELNLTGRVNFSNYRTVRSYRENDRPESVARSVDSLDVLVDGPRVNAAGVDDREETSLWAEIPPQSLHIIPLYGRIFGALDAPCMPVFAHKPHEDPWAIHARHYMRDVSRIFTYRSRISKYI